MYNYVYIYISLIHSRWCWKEIHLSEQLCRFNPLCGCWNPHIWYHLLWEKQIHPWFVSEVPDVRNTATMGPPRVHGAARRPLDGWRQSVPVLGIKWIEHWWIDGLMIDGLMDWWINCSSILRFHIFPCLWKKQIYGTHSKNRGQEMPWARDGCVAMTKWASDWSQKLVRWQIWMAMDPHMEMLTGKP